MIGAGSKYRHLLCEWARQDSNLRRQSHQIYSLTRLSTSVHARNCLHARITNIIVAAREPRSIAARGGFSSSGL
jgi:hypothetical protein